MIITQLIGGLGNQLFQYAAGRSLAMHHNTELKLDITQFKKIKNITPRQYGLYPFKIKEIFAVEEDLHCVKKPSSLIKKWYVGIHCALTGNPVISFKKELHFQFNPCFFTLPNNVYLEGYWQTEKYFKSIASTIRSEITLKEEMKGKNRELKEKILCDENSVSIHIRRGDYVTNNLINQIHGCCSLRYYQKGIQKINDLLDSPRYYVFSDDIPWAKENLKINNPIIFIENTAPEKDYEELILMSLCRHHLIANSSFSWWGAWLGTTADKITIAPSQWVKDPLRDMNDLIPDDWIKIND